MRGLCSAAGLVLLCVSPSLARAQEIPEWAQEYLAEWYEAFNAGDVAAVANQYATDAVMLPPEGSAIVGRDAIESNLERDLAQASIACHGAYDGFQQVGELATAWGRDTCTTTPRGGGTSQTSKSRWLSVYQRQPDGSWLVVRETWEDLAVDDGSSD